MYAYRQQNLPILLIAAYTSAKLCMMPLYFFFILLMTVQHRAFSHVLQASEVLDPAMIRRQSSSSAPPSPSSLDRMELEKQYGRLVLCSHSPRECSLSPALPPHPFFPCSTVFRGPHPACHWQKTGWGPADEAIKISSLCRFILFLVGTFIRENYHRITNYHRSDYLYVTTTLIYYNNCFACYPQTIIECLKYATTGDQPPNTKGGAFVHDPKVKLLPTAATQSVPTACRCGLLSHCSNACTHTHNTYDLCSL